MITPVGSSRSTVRDAPRPGPAAPRGAASVPPGFSEAHALGVSAARAFILRLSHRIGCALKGRVPTAGEPRGALRRGRSWRRRGRWRRRVLEPPGGGQPPRLSPWACTQSHGLHGRPQARAQEPGLREPRGRQLGETRVSGRSPPWSPRLCTCPVPLGPHARSRLREAPPEADTRFPREEAWQSRVTRVPLMLLWR